MKHEQRNGHLPHVAHSSYACPWCWKAMYPGVPFPVGQNAFICREHYRELVEDVKAHYMSQKPIMNKSSCKP